MRVRLPEAPRPPGRARTQDQAGRVWRMVRVVSSALIPVRGLLVELFAGKHMGVRVEHGLSGVDAGVEDQTEGAMELLVGDFLRQLRPYGRAVPDRLGPARRRWPNDACAARSVRAPSLGINVLERVGGVVLIHLSARNLTCNNLAEQAILASLIALLIGIGKTLATMLHHAETGHRNYAMSCETSQSRREQ